MKINGKDYELSPRKAKDVLDLTEACKDQEESNLSGFVVMTQVICDSLKATRQGLPFLKRLFTKKITVKHLLAQLSTLDISNAFNEIVELEGGKKKVVAEKQSDEMLQKE
jgi:hypothetical protein